MHVSLESCSTLFKFPNIFQRIGCETILVHSAWLCTSRTRRMRRLTNAACVMRWVPAAAVSFSCCNCTAGASLITSWQSSKLHWCISMGVGGGLRRLHAAGATSGRDSRLGLWAPDERSGCLVPPRHLADSYWTHTDLCSSDVTDKVIHFSFFQVVVW